MIPGGPFRPGKPRSPMEPGEPGLPLSPLMRLGKPGAPGKPGGPGWPASPLSPGKEADVLGKHSGQEKICSPSSRCPRSQVGKGKAWGQLAGGGMGVGGGAFGLMGHQPGPPSFLSGKAALCLPPTICLAPPGVQPPVVQKLSSTGTVQTSSLTVQILLRPRKGGLRAPSRQPLAPTWVL